MFFSEKAGRLPIISVSDAPVKDGMWAGDGLLRGRLCDDCFCVELLRLFGKVSRGLAFQKLSFLTFMSVTVERGRHLSDT